MCLYVCMCFLSERVKEKTTTNFALSAKFCDNLVRAILPCIRKVIFVVLVLVFFQRSIQRSLRLQLPSIE